MTRQVLFNGAVLVRAGGATKVDASAFQNVGVTGIGTVGVIGEADGGEPSAAMIFTDPREMVNAFRSGPLADAAELAFRPMNDPRVPGGAASVVAIKVNASLQSSKMFEKAGTDELNIVSKDYGAHTNKITAEISDSGGGKVLEFVFEDGNRRLVETSPVLGGAAEFTVAYTGAGSAATMTITKTKITTSITGGPGSEALDLEFATYTTLQEMLNAINAFAGGVYTAVAVTKNPYTFECTDLDRVSAVNIKTTPANFYAVVYRMVEWTERFSSLVTAVRASGAGTEGDQAPAATVGPVPLTGGSRGTSDNTAWQDALDLIGTLRINQLVPLASEDLTNLGQGSTATFASIVAATDSHVAYYSSTQGKNEQQAFVGMKGTKTEILTQAGTLQSFNTVLVGQVVTRNDASGSLVQFPEWGLAVIAAGGRAGSLLGEPLTYKSIRASGLTQDASWNPTDDGADMILGGVTFAFAPAGQGFKFDRVVTTYTKDDNDAYVEESIVQGWKNVAYGLRTQLEAIFTGIKGTPITVAGVKDAATRIFEAYRQETQIVDSILEDGTIERAYRELKVTFSGDTVSLSAIISPVAGINFQLNTLFLVPATIVV